MFCKTKISRYFVTFINDSNITMIFNMCWILCNQSIIVSVAIYVVKIYLLNSVGSVIVLAVHNSSIGDLVPHSVTDLVSQGLLPWGWHICKDTPVSDLKSWTTQLSQGMTGQSGKLPTSLQSRNIIWHLWGGWGLPWGWHIPLAGVELKKLNHPT